MNFEFGCPFSNVHDQEFTGDESELIGIQFKVRLYLILYPLNILKFSKWPLPNIRTELYPGKHPNLRCVDLFKKFLRSVKSLVMKSN